MSDISPPLALLAELTHRCPLQCPYCSNPINLERASQELTTAEWARAIDEAAAMGVLQIHFSGGEPTVRPDLEKLVRRAHDAGLYTNLITAGVLANYANSLAEQGRFEDAERIYDEAIAVGERAGPGSNTFLFILVSAARTSQRLGVCIMSRIIERSFIYCVNIRSFV